MKSTISKHCRRWRCRHVVGCLCNCKACAKIRPEDERRAWEKSRATVGLTNVPKGEPSEGA